MHATSTNSSTCPPLHSAPCGLVPCPIRYPTPSSVPLAPSPAASAPMRTPQRPDPYLVLARRLLHLLCLLAGLDVVVAELQRKVQLDPEPAPPDAPTPPVCPADSVPPHTLGRSPYAPCATSVPPNARGRPQTRHARRQYRLIRLGGYRTGRGVQNGARGAGGSPDSEGARVVASQLPLQHVPEAVQFRSVRASLSMHCSTGHRVGRRRPIARPATAGLVPLHVVW